MNPRQIFYLFILIIFLNADTANSKHILEKNLGVIVGTNVRARSGPGTDSSITAKFNTGNLVKVLDKTEKPVRLIKSRQFHYHWYKVEYKPGKTAWIYGQFLYLYSSMNNKFSSVFNFNGKKYRVLEFNEQAIEYDMPEQDKYTFPCIYSINEAKAYPLYINPSLYNKILFRYLVCKYEKDPYLCYKKELFLFIGNTGGGDGIDKKPYVKSSAIIIPVSVSQPDGGSTYEMKIVFSNGRFRIADIINYK